MGGQLCEHAEIYHSSELELRRQRALWGKKIGHTSATGTPAVFIQSGMCSENAELMQQQDTSRAACEDYYFAQESTHAEQTETIASRWGAPLQNQFLRPLMVRRDSGLFAGRTEL